MIILYMETKGIGVERKGELNAQRQCLLITPSVVADVSSVTASVLRHKTVVHMLDIVIAHVSA